MLLPVIKTHDGVLKNAIKTFSILFLHDPVFGPNSTKMLISQVLLMGN